MIAMISGGVVREIFTLPLGFTVAECIHAALLTNCVDVTSVTPQPQQGWIATESGGIWSFTSPPPPGAPTLAQQAVSAVSAGLTIALSGTLTLAATLFPTDPTTTGKIGAVVTTVVATTAFPGGASSYPMKDASGAWHTFTVAQYTKVAGAIAAYVAALDLIIDGNPLNATALPAASVALVV